jgi:hypothetical protein
MFKPKNATSRIDTKKNPSQKPRLNNGLVRTQQMQKVGKGISGHILINNRVSKNGLWALIFMPGNWPLWAPAPAL